MGVRLELGVQVNTQDEAANTSNVTATIDAASDYGSYNNGQARGTVRFGGNASGEFEFTSAFAANTTTRIYTRTFTVRHGEDGTATVTMDATFDTEVSSGVVSGSASVTLKSIPRASVPTVSGSPQLGSGIVISTNRASSAYTHTLKWAWAGRSGIIAQEVGASYTWTPPVAQFAPYLTDADKAECTITCNTYSGAKAIGTKETKFTLRLPSTVVPVFVDSDISDQTGLAAKYGAIVRGMSELVVDVEAEGRYGAGITKYFAALDGTTVYNADGHLRLGKPVLAGSRLIKLTAIDTRGRSNSGDKAIEVADYSVPVLTVRAYRADASTGDELDESTTVRVIIAGSVTDVNGAGLNRATVRVAAGELGDELAEVHAAELGQAFETHVDVPDCDETKAYEFAVTVTDSLGGTVTARSSVGTAEPVMDFRANGRGLAVFGIADEDRLKVYGSMELAARGSEAAGLLWPSGGLRGNVRRTLWEGTATPGQTITVDGLDQYNVFVIVAGASGESCLAVRTNAGGNGSYIIGSYVATGASAQTVHSVRLQSQSASTVKYIYGKATQLSSGSVGAPTDISITRIEGVI